ncbi:MAG: abortive infection family protein [Nocardioidaceae bacterium]|nr:abortive infection family protein [Nocardioidaceae bacterium]
MAFDIAGDPEKSEADLKGVVSGAHNLLAAQPGRDLTQGGDFARMASQASKMAQNLGAIRNEFGGGHGRGRTPRIRDEMVDLALDGGLTWARWAVRRLGLFSEGRPASLIRDLVEQSATFHSGVLRRRLEAANLPALEEHHQQELGVAVGQRVMRQTFVVKWDGLDPCLESDDLKTWPAGYRVGLLRGLWFSPEGHPTVTDASIRNGLTVLDPVPDCAEELAHQVTRLRTSTQPLASYQEDVDLVETATWVSRRKADRPQSERVALEELERYLTDRSS